MRELAPLMVLHLIGCEHFFFNSWPQSVGLTVKLRGVFSPSPTGNMRGRMHPTDLISRRKLLRTRIWLGRMHPTELISRYMPSQTRRMKQNLRSWSFLAGICSGRTRTTKAITENLLGRMHPTKRRTHPTKHTTRRESPNARRKGHGRRAQRHGTRGKTRDSGILQRRMGQRGPRSSP
jgi:hypothetical protein